MTYKCLKGRLWLHKVEHICGAFATGMTSGTLAGMIVADQILGRQNPFSKVCMFASAPDSLPSNFRHY